MSSHFGFELSIPASSYELFKRTLEIRMRELAMTSGYRTFSMPVGLFFVIDEKHGGGITAAEIAKRFRLLGIESANAVDFYFLGWQPDDSVEEGIRFDLADFDACRAALRNCGVNAFSGYADILLLDAMYFDDQVWLDFGKTIRIDLSNEDMQPLGRTLQSVIDAAQSIRNLPPSESPVHHMSDRLGVAYGSQSLLDHVLGKLGALIGAKRLQSFATRHQGAAVQLLRM